MTLTDLLASATPGPWTACPAWGSHLSWTDIRGADNSWPAETKHRPENEARPADGQLIALAPEMARLLTDMAAKLGHDSGDVAVLLARFADLNERAEA